MVIGRPASRPPVLDARRVSAVAIGASTGAPRLLEQIITNLPADLPVPIFIAQHLPPSFTASMAVSLDHRSALSVVEAADGMPVYAGTVYIGKGRQHMRIQRGIGGRRHIEISELPKDLVYKPSVDELFRSCAKVYGLGLVGVVMTGIGRDGTEGAAEVKATGGFIATQDQASCSVYGMPKSCLEAGLSDAVLDPQGIRDLILQLSPQYGKTVTA